MTTRTHCFFARLLALTLIVALASPLAACGRKGSPERTDETQYPRSYPAE